MAVLYVCTSMSYNAHPPSCPHTLPPHTLTPSALFQVLAAGEDSLSLDHVTRLLEHVIQVPQLVSEHQYCSLTEVDLCARECFRKVGGVL